MGGANRRDFAILLSLIALISSVLMVFGLVAYAAWTYFFALGF